MERGPRGTIGNLFGFFLEGGGGGGGGGVLYRERKEKNVCDCCMRWLDMPCGV